MPCDRSYTQTVEFKNADLATLEAALRAAGYTVNTYEWGLDAYKAGAYVTYDHRNGTLDTTGVVGGGNEVKRAYSRQVVATVARQRGWKVQEREGGRRGTVTRSW